MKINDKKYQVWLTDYPLAANAPENKYDPGYKLAGTFDTITRAVGYTNEKHFSSFIITKLVTWRTDIIDITEAKEI